MTKPLATSNTSKQTRNNTGVQTCPDPLTTHEEKADEFMRYVERLSQKPSFVPKGCGMRYHKPKSRSLSDMLKGHTKREAKLPTQSLKREVLIFKGFDMNTIKKKTINLKPKLKELRQTHFCKHHQVNAVVYQYPDHYGTQTRLLNEPYRSGRGDYDTVSLIAESEL